MNLFSNKSIKDFFVKDKGENGAAAVEFALAGSLVIITVISIIEILAIIFINILIEGGVREASRFGVTGNEGATTRSEQILTIIGNHTMGLVDMESATVTTLVYENFESIGQEEEYIDDSPANGSYDEGEAYTDTNANGQWDEDQGVVGVGGSEEIVLYKIEYDVPFITGILAPLVGKDSLRLTAAIPVKNEPYEVE